MWPVFSKFAVGSNSFHMCVSVCFVFVHSHDPKYLEQFLAYSRHSLNVIMNKLMEVVEYNKKLRENLMKSSSKEPC